MVPRKDYAELLKQIKDRIVSARVTAAREVNKELSRLYWDIGRAIVEKQAIDGWGNAMVEKLAKDLRRELPEHRGFSAFNLWRMRKLYVAYSSSERLTQGVPEIVYSGAVIALPEQHKKVVGELLAPVLGIEPKRRARRKLTE